MTLGSLDSFLSPVANQKDKNQSEEEPPPFFVNSPQNEFPSPRVRGWRTHQGLPGKSLEFQGWKLYYVFQPLKKSQEGPGPHSLTL